MDDISSNLVNNPAFETKKTDDEISKSLMCKYDVHVYGFSVQSGKPCITNANMKNFLFETELFRNVADDLYYDNAHPDDEMFLIPPLSAFYSAKIADLKKAHVMQEHVLDQFKAKLRIYILETWNDANVPISKLTDRTLDAYVMNSDSVIFLQDNLNDIKYYLDLVKSWNTSLSMKHEILVEDTRNRRNEARLIGSSVTKS